MSLCDQTTNLTTHMWTASLSFFPNFALVYERQQQFLCSFRGLSGSLQYRTDLLRIIANTADSFLGVSTSMTLNDLEPQK